MELSKSTIEVIQRIKQYPEREKMPNTYSYNAGVRTAWEPMWVRNLARSYQEVEKRFEKEDADIRSMPHVSGPILLLGSGPSLDDVIPLLKDWKGAVACSTSQMLLLEYLGVKPTFCFLIDCDPNPEIMKLLTDYQGGTDTVLVTHPQIPREYLEAWKGPAKFFRMYDPGDTFSTKYVPMAVGWLNQEKHYHIGSYVLNSGNVINTAIPVLAGLGYSPIFLCGYDLGYPGRVYRGKSVKRIDGKLVMQDPAPIPSQKVRPIKYAPSINGVMSDELCYFYKYSFMILYALGNPPILSCSRGILGEVPYVKPAEVVAKQGVGFESMFRGPVDAYEIGKTYLAPRQVYILKTDFSTETVNIFAKKPGWERETYKLRWRWLQSRPWAWRGDKIGLLPTFWRTYQNMKRQWKAAAAQKKAEANK